MSPLVPAMRLAIVADVHGNLPALEAVLADLPRHAPDLLVNLGDAATAPLWPRETVEALQALGIPSVRGNHDRWLREPPWPAPPPSVAYVHAELAPAQVDWLAALPAELRLDGDVLAVHGAPGDDTAHLLEESVAGRLALVAQPRLADRLAGIEASLVLCGHSHVQHAATCGGRLVVNPGSVGCPRYADNAEPLAAEPGVLMAQYAVATRRGARWALDLCSVPYDLAPVLERARANGRSDWAAAFLGR